MGAGNLDRITGDFTKVKDEGNATHLKSDSRWQDATEDLYRYYLWRTLLVSWWGLALQCPPDWPSRYVVNGVVRHTSLFTLSFSATFAGAFCSTLALAVRWRLSSLAMLLFVMACGGVVLAAMVPIRHDNAASAKILTA